jgi:hypothetical protein
MSGFFHFLLVALWGLLSTNGSIFSIDLNKRGSFFRSTKKLIVANVLLPVNSNETLLHVLSISLLKNTRQIVFESCFESSKILLSTVALESRFKLLSKRSELLSHKAVSFHH